MGSASTVAGHATHLVLGIAGQVLHALDDHATDPIGRNDLGPFFFLTFEADTLTRPEAVSPTRALFTRLACGEEAAPVAERFRQPCTALGTEVVERTEASRSSGRPSPPRRQARRNQSGKSAAASSPAAAPLRPSSHELTRSKTVCTPLPARSTIEENRVR